MSAPLPASNAATAGTCYKYQYLYSDNVGNQATYTSNSVAKVLDPATAVVLGDDDSSSAMFSLTGLIPGSMGEKCIAVTYTGTVAANVELYLPTASYTGTGLGSYVDMTIEEGTGGSFAGGCTGFAATGGAPVYSGTLANFAATRNTYATGFGTFAPSGGPPSTTRVYRFTYRVRGDNAAQGLNSSATFTWQAQDS